MLDKHEQAEESFGDGERAHRTAYASLGELVEAIEKANARATARARRR
ncbi:hypothetical protein KBX50_12355 [Micromonospora sp. C51]|nr:hypothetical protein [Micromonospora sp. C51]MBQ1049249.1 hypothetical protein [Micromonospora sp. C51]